MYHIIAVDDESNALERFMRLAHAEPRISSVATFTDPEEAMEYCRHNQVEVAFLDIDMPEISGLRLAEKLYLVCPDINIVFVTAYEHYAVEAFRVSALHYLLKPIGEDDLKALCDRLELKHNRKPVQAADTRLRVQCFGTFLCYIGNDKASRILWRTAKSEELFALLLQFNGAPVYKEYLLDKLWMDSSPKKALNNFRVTCTYLRKALSDKGFYDILCRDKENYWLNMKRIECDMQKFLSLTAASATMNYKQLDQAVQLYTSWYMEDKAYEWATRHRQWLDNEYKRIQFLLAQEDKNQQQYTMICKRMKAVLLLDPFEEGAILRYIQAKLQLGEVTSAKVEYQKFEKNLWKEFKLTPSAVLKELFC